MQRTGRVAISSNENGVGKTELARQYAQYCWQQQLYPGGVCWLWVQDENVGLQVVEFAKSQLDLKLPENLNLQEQINYCWLHWLPGDVLMVLDNVKDYQQVELYLPPTKRRFKVLITTSQQELNNSFELLLLQALEEEPKDETNNERNDESYLYILLGIVLSLLLVNTVSLIGSYILCNSPAWQKEFNPNGWIIELIRSVIFVFAEIGIVFLNFKREASEYFGFIRPPNSYKIIINLIRLLMSVIATASIIWLVYYHLNIAPNNLAEFWNLTNGLETPTLESSEGFKLYKLPYLWYLPYSFINYILVGGTVISVSLYAATKDLTNLYLYGKLFEQRIKEIYVLRGEVSQVFFRQKFCQRVERNFETFCRNFIDKIGRYTFLFLVFSLGVSFEVLVGRITLAAMATLWIFVGYLLFAASLATIFLGYLHYENALKKSANLLFSLHCDNLTVFEDKNNVIKFLQRVFRNYLSLYLGIILITAASLLAVIIEVLSKIQN